MKRYLFPFLLAGLACLPAYVAQAQEKPVLNTAPPGPPPAQPKPVSPAPAPAAEPAAPAPAPATSQPETEVRPSSEAPSGLDFPNRANTKAGGAETQPPTRKFLYTNLGLGYTSGRGLSQFNISGAPAVGFRLNNKFAVGPGISYAYNSFALQDGYATNTPKGTLTAEGSNSLSTSSLGIKLFAQYIVYKEFFLHAEYEVTNAQLVGDDGSGYLVKVNRKVTSPLAGVGYRSYFSDNVAIDILGLYNFQSSIYSLYPGLNLRFSFLFNFGK